MTRHDAAFPADELTVFAAAAIAKLGSSPQEADDVARHLVGANLAGHDSHGIGLLPAYAKHVRAGLVTPDAKTETTKDAGAILQFDANGGYGAPAGRVAVKAAVARAKDNGVCVATLGNVHHLGRIGAFGEQAAAAGLAFVAFVNVAGHAPLVAPFRGAQARFGTNPVCVTLPATKKTPVFLLDMATSRIALGKVRVAASKGERVPFGAVLDEDGEPTDDPTGMGSPDYSEHVGALAFAGEHKGYALGFAAELLAGALSGSGTIKPEDAETGGLQNRMIAIVMDPAAFADSDWIAREVDAMRAYALSSPPADPDEPVLYPGDPERIARRIRTANGAPLDAGTIHRLEALAVDLEIASPFARQFAG